MSIESAHKVWLLVEELRELERMPHYTAEKGFGNALHEVTFRAMNRDATRLPDWLVEPIAKFVENYTARRILELKEQLQSIEIHGIESMLEVAAV